ncbi:MAG: radical SAM protein [bacterium]|jgi:MoaA/NifB/PqqE/SkfB family radical SAM enzyme
MQRTTRSWIDLLGWNDMARGLPSVIKAMAGRPVPLRVTHCITYRCNLDCAYCSRHDIPGSELSTEQIKQLLALFRDAGTLFWSFNGGEALVRDDLGELLTAGRNLGITMSFATNGVLIPDRIDEIKDAEMVSVSIDGPGDVQDAVRSSSYGAVIKGLDAMVARGIRFNLFAVIGSHNLDSLNHVIDLAGHYGTAAFFQPIRIQKEDQTGNARSFFPEVERMREAMVYLIDEKRRGRPVASSFEYLESIRECWPDRMPPVRCYGGRLFCFITPDGFVTQCCDTLASAAADNRRNIMTHGIAAMESIPPLECATCYSSLPLEANLFFSNLRRNPLGAVGKAIRGALGV